MSTSPTFDALPTGTLFHGRYEVVRQIAAGGMGAIYEVVHATTRKRVALKLMLPEVVANPAMRSRFELEARATSEIESEHIVQTLDAGVDDATGIPFLVMELLRGEDLRDILRARKRLPPEETLVYLSQAALALEKTHAAGIVHRDLKPDNFFVTRRDDGSPKLKILDFGIAKVVAAGAQAGARTATIGTPHYMSPEQILGEGTIGPRADLYALGHIAYTLLVGSPYWQLEADATTSVVVFLGQVMDGMKEPAVARAARAGVSLPAGFEAWFVKATARDAADRFESATALVAALKAALDPTAGPRASEPGPPPVSAPTSTASGTVIIPEGMFAPKTSPSFQAATGGVSASTTNGPITSVVPEPPAAIPVHSRAPLFVALFALIAGGAAGAWLLLRPKTEAGPTSAASASASTSSVASAAPPPAASSAAPAAKPPVKLAVVEVKGKLPQEGAEKAVGGIADKLHACARGKALSGKLTVNVVVGKTGAVGAVTDAGSEKALAGTLPCVTKELRALTFPAPGVLSTVKLEIGFGAP